MEVLAFRSEETTCSSTTMLFHGLPGGEMQGVIDEMDRRGKGDSAAISSAIDMGETEAVSLNWALSLKYIMMCGVQYISLNVSVVFW